MLPSYLARPKNVTMLAWISDFEIYFFRDPDYVACTYNTRYLPLFGPNRKNRFTRLAKMARARSLAAI